MKIQEELEYKEEYSLLSNGIINITDDCNLQCKYCFVEQHPHYITLQTAKDIADFLYQNAQKKKRLGLIPEDKKSDYYFFGGEPMLQYDNIIVPIVQYCEEKYPNSFRYGITTNGTLLSKERIDFFKKYNFGMMLSMDGIKESQDYTRPCRNCKQSSYDMMIKNIPYLLEQMPYVIARGTAYCETAQYLFENYKFAESLGFKNWAYLADQRHNWSKEQINILEEQLNKICEYRLEQVLSGIVPMYSWRHSFWMRNTAALIDQSSNIYDIENNNSVIRCGLATGLGAIGYDGAIYGCQEQCSRDDKNIFYIGNIYTGGINPEQHKKLLQFYYNTQNNPKDKKEECKNCALRRACRVNTLICPSSSIDTFNNMEDITEINCKLRQIYYKNCLLNLIILTQIEHNEFIEQFLKREIIGQGG